MNVLLAYASATGQLLGVWEAEASTVLTAPALVGAETMQYALTETEISPADLLAGYVWHDGTLVSKPAATFVAEPPALVADGQSECVVTLVPFVACMVLIDGQPLALTVEDPIAVLTADAPHIFQIELMAPAPCQAAAITVEAR